jgi:hypothetical protein
MQGRKSRQNGSGKAKGERVRNPEMARVLQLTSCSLIYA